ncbi:angiomotin-like 2a [Coregonus clupeaformis]|uniref:angiomotin-like 2a n=1 Tax=Coregonus clupeaformis TaxID=59861 RepID=UPI001E1C3B01|nr:angiomotin-like 2a [Coregonus clupeaformis]
MRTAEESSGTVLHRLIQEQLRYGNLTDTSTLLSIQQQALRGGSNSSGGGGGTGSPRSSLESLTQEESQFLHMSTRQDPQGQEHKGDHNHCESDSVCRLYQLHRHGEELPTYEEAKAHSQYMASVGAQWGQPQLGLGLDVMDHQGGGEGQEDLKRKHARSLSERLMRLSLERSSGDIQPLTSSHSYPQLSNGHSGPVEHQGTEFLQYPDQRGPPPDYPFLVRAPGYMLSHSQETHGHRYQDPPPPFHSQHRYVPAQPQAEMVRHSVRSGPEVYMSHSSPSTAQMDLFRENERLRKEVEGYSEKAARLQKLEVEIQRISEAYETLMNGSAKRETLEKTMRNKLESEIKRLHDFNRDLRDRLDTATKQLVAKEVESADQKQQVFNKLLKQNEQQQWEVQRLRGSGEEWLRCREVLELALRSAQARNLALEEELGRKRAYVEKVERLQSALGQLQAVCEKREALELRLRTRLEQELKSLRAAQSHSAASGPGSTVSVQLQLAEGEERILALEADVTRWEQKYLEESTMRQFAMDAAATAAAQRDTSVIKRSPRHSPNSSFNDHLPSSRRHQEMENRVRVLHSQLLEKDAVIRVLQQRSQREQIRLEQQALRPARSVPSVSTEANGSTSTSGPVEQPIRGKGKSLSDDQTATAVCPLSLSPHQHPCAPPALPALLFLSKPRSRDSSTQCDRDVPAQETDPTGTLAPPEASSTSTLASEHFQAPLNTHKSTSSSDAVAEVVEILI